MLRFECMIVPGDTISALRQKNRKNDGELSCLSLRREIINGGKTARFELNT